MGGRAKPHEKIKGKKEKMNKKNTRYLHKVHQTRRPVSKQFRFAKARTAGGKSPKRAPASGPIRGCGCPGPALRRAQPVSPGVACGCICSESPAAWALAMQPCGTRTTARHARLSEFGGEGTARVDEVHRLLMLGIAGMPTRVILLHSPWVCGADLGKVTGRASWCGGVTSWLPNSKMKPLLLIHPLQPRQMLRR
jgi:hypothetical protein